MPDSDYTPGDDRLAPLVASWLGKIKSAGEAKKNFSRIARHCRVFTRGGSEFWKENGIYSEYMDSDVQPRFKMTFAKVFELLAQFGPLLYARNPSRHCESRDGIDVIPDLIQIPPEVPPEQADAFRQQQAQSISQQQDTGRRRDRSVAELTEYVLNYLPGEQPGGGLYSHARRAVGEALITGRGCLWTEIYDQPDAGKRLVQSVFDTVDNLLIDPDARKPDLSDAWWIAQKVVEPVWKVEERYGLPKDKLKGHNESSDRQSNMDPNRTEQDRRNGETNDLLTYYKIWSKTGVGFRHQLNSHQGHDTEAIKALDEFLGDHVFLVITAGCNYPLNAPSEALSAPGVEDEEIKWRFRWPVEHWRDNAWPVSVLDFYENEKSPWPMAPMQPAMGEIVFVNVMLSSLANRSYEGSKDLIGVLQENFDEVQEALNQDKPFRLFPISDSGGTRNINEMVQVFQERPVSFDAWRIIDQMLKSIERRTGLTDAMAATTTTQSRSAADADGKQQQISIRPDDMSAQVENWQQVVAKAERLTLHSWITGNDLSYILGPYGAWVWDTLIKQIPIEVVLRSSDITIEPGSIRKPNLATEISNLEKMTPLLMPVLQQYAGTTTDTGPLMWWITRISDALQLDMDGLQIGPMMPPPPPPEQQQMIQQEQQGEQQAEQQAQQAQQQMLQQKLQVGQMEAQMKGQQLQQESAIKAQQMQTDAQMQQLSAGIEMQQAKVRMAESQQQAEFNRAEFLHKMQELQMQGAEQGRQSSK